MPTPTLTIGLPVLNEGRHLRETLASIQAQSFTDWELIAIDDGSSDETLSILHEFAMLDQRLRVVSDGKNLGLAARLNQIVELSRGRYIARTDGDGLCHPDRFRLQLDALLTEPKLDGVGCGLLILDTKGSLAGVRRFPATHDAICARPLKGIAIAHPTLLARRDWFVRHPYNEGNLVCEDFELWYDSYPTSRFGNLADPLYVYREFDSYSVLEYIRLKARIAAIQWNWRARFGRARTAMCVAGQFARMGLHVIGGAIGFTYYLVKRRSEEPDERAKRLLAEILAAVRVNSPSLAIQLARPDTAVEDIIAQPGHSLGD